MRPPAISLASRALVGLDQAAILVRQEQDLGVAIVEHLLQRIGRRHGRQRHHAGAGAQPPMKVSRYSIELVARMAILSPRPTPMPASARAILLMRLSNCAPCARPCPRTSPRACRARPGVARHAYRDRDELGKIAQRRLRHQKRVGTHASRRLLLRLDLLDRSARLLPGAEAALEMRHRRQPMSCAVLVASAERQAPAQKNTNLLPVWK